MRSVEIIGGGLAGLGLGIALRKNSVPVVIHEAGHYPRHRVCGEFITSLDRDTCRFLEIDDVLDHARRAYGVSWCEDNEADIKHRLPEPAFCLSRHKLDQAMARRFAELGGDLRQGSRAKLSAREGCVLACGRRADPSSRWVGVKQHFLGVKLRDDLEVHFGHGGYIGLTAVETQTVNVCGLLRRDSADFTGTLADIAREAGMGSLAKRLAAAQAVPDSFCAVAGLDYSAPSGEEGSFRIGDHASIVPPFTGHGMTIALQSAVAALPSLLRWTRSETDWDTTVRQGARAQARLFGRRWRAARLIHPLMLDARARRLAGKLQQYGLLPVGWLYRLLH